MVIGFDAKRAFHNYRGLGSYSRSVIAGLCKHHPENQYHLYDSRVPPKGGWSEWCGEVHNYGTTLKSIKRTLGIGLNLRKQGIDIYHGLSNEIPYNYFKNSTRMVVTIHDILFLKRKGDYPYLDQKIYTAKTRYAIKNADLVIAVSKNTKQDLINHYSIQESKVSIIPPICDALFFQQQNRLELNAFAVNNKLPDKFLLFVGALTPNKNLLVVIKALEMIKDQHLVIVGQGPQQFQVLNEIRNRNLCGRVHLISDLPVSKEKLAMIYKLADYTIVPSFYEGFGLPIIESLASGTPVICSDTLSTTCGQGGLTFEPSNANDLAEILMTYPKGCTNYDEYQKKGMIHANQFKAKQLSHELFAQYERLV